MSNEKTSIETELKKLNSNFNTLNKVMSCFLVIATTESNFKSKTNDEIVAIMPQINETLKSIHENIYD
tara:strand:- start:12 stop:215 length:204 start_codon:yes stop_codon:yes gene_type:complete